MQEYVSPILNIFINDDGALAASSEAGVVFFQSSFRNFQCR
jgi:hypothetical protein